MKLLVICVQYLEKNFLHSESGEKHMKPYGLNSNLRYKVEYRIVVLCILLSVLLSPMVHSLWNEFVKKYPFISEYVSRLDFVGILVSPMTIAILYPCIKSLFKNFLWRKKFFVRILEVPNLNGKWKGILHSTFDSGKEVPMILTIKQNWEEMSCHCVFPDTNSTSEALVINLDISDSSIPKLMFKYQNQSYNSAETLLQPHTGYNELTIEGTRIKGIYFTNRSPQTNGTIDLTLDNL